MSQAKLTGTSDGTLTWDNSLILTNQHIKKVSSNSVTGIFSGPTQYEGGFVILRGATHNETSEQGRASLAGATSTSVWSTINVYPDGKVTLSKPSHNNYASLDDIAVTAKLITSSGYISLACGLIIQWGSQGATSDGVTNNFPISYTNAVTYINTKWTSQNQSVAAYKAEIIANSKSSFTLYGFDTVSRAYYWFAIGY